MPTSAKRKTMKNKSFILLPPDADSLRQHCIRANYLAYLVRHPVKLHHPSPIGHGLELSAGRCRPVRHTMPALPLQLPVQTPAEESDDDAGDDGCEDEDDDVQRRICARLELDVSESSETESSDSD